MQAQFSFADFEVTFEDDGTTTVKFRGEVLDAERASLDFESDATTKDQRVSLRLTWKNKPVTRKTK